MHNHFNGFIHSVFHHACNISIDNQSLITLLSSSLDNAPQGIRLDTPPDFTFEDYLELGQPVGCRANILRFSRSSISIDLRSARSWRSDLSALRIDIDEPSTFRAWRAVWEKLRCRNHGLAAILTKGSILEENQSLLSDTKILVQTARKCFPKLLYATGKQQVDKAASALKPLIGLGPGLTPSGDDFIVGYLTGLWSTAGEERSRRNFLSSIGKWLATALNETNEISRTYINYAIEGEVSEPLAVLARRIAQGENSNCIKESTEAAFQVGSTSGTDGVLGLLLGILAWYHSPSQFLSTDFLNGESFGNSSSKEGKNGYAAKNHAQSLSGFSIADAAFIQTRRFIRGRTGIGCHGDGQQPRFTQRSRPVGGQERCRTKRFAHRDSRGR